MRTENAAWFACPPDAAYRLACQVDRWPDLLPHYRWVRFHDGGPAEGGIVEMAARRPFGRRLAWPVWWVSRMVCDQERRTVRYTHIDGITRGMEVLWTVAPSYGGARVVVLHEWDGGPRFCGPAARPVARRVVGPVFIHHVAGQTLHHLAVEARKELSAWRGAGR